MKQLKKLYITIIAAIMLMGCGNTANPDSDSEVAQISEMDETSELEQVNVASAETETKEDLSKKDPKLQAVNKEIELHVGEQQKLMFQAEYVPELVYTSSDESIASVDQQGIVTAQGSGNAVITASYKNYSCQWSIQSNLDWEKVYAEFLEHKMQEDYFFNNDKVVLVQINNDDIPELVLVEGYSYEIFTIQNMEVMSVFDFNDMSYNVGAWYYEKTGIVYFVADHQGTWTDFYCIQDDGNIADKKMTEAMGWEDDDAGECIYYTKWYTSGIEWTENGYADKEEMSEEAFNQKLSEITQGKEATEIYCDKTPSEMIDYLKNTNYYNTIEETYEE